MLNLNLRDFTIELRDGSVRNVGAPNKSAEAKLFDVESVEVRAFGDSRVKLVAADADGNEVQVALTPAQATRVQEDVESLRTDSQVFE